MHTKSDHRFNCQERHVGCHSTCERYAFPYCVYPALKVVTYIHPQRRYVTVAIMVDGKEIKESFRLEEVLA